MASIMEMSLMCRLCLAKDKNQVNIPIFEDPGDIRQIFVKISSCLPIKISRDDQLPKNICDGCGDKLELLYEFWNTSLDSEKTLTAWLKQVKDPAVSAVAQQISKPAETLVKEETDAAEASTYLEPAQESSINEEAEIEEVEPEEPPKKRARRTAAVKAQINIAPESDDEDDNFDNNMDEPDSVDADVIAKLEGESEESDGDEKDPSFADLPGTSTQDQPGTSGLGKDGAEAPFEMIYIEVVKDSKQRKQPKMLRCHWCKKYFGSEAVLQNHIKFSHDDGEKKCKICKLTFEHSKAREAHMQECHLGKFNHYCKLCEEGFALRNDYEHHKETVHEPKKSCKICKQFFDSSRSLKVHMDTHIEAKTKHEECPICKEQVKNLQRHYFQSHTEERKSICHICGKGFKELGTLKLHIMIHKGIRPHICNVCGYEFLTKQKLTVHMRRHTGEKPYSCEVCAKTFTRRGGLVQHFRLHSGEKPYSCKYCPDTFSRQWYLTKHLRSQHKDIDL